MQTQQALPLVCCRELIAALQALRTLACFLLLATSSHMTDPQATLLRPEQAYSLLALQSAKPKITLADEEVGRGCSPHPRSGKVFQSAAASAVPARSCPAFLWEACSLVRHWSCMLSAVASQAKPTVTPRLLRDNVEAAYKVFLEQFGQEPMAQQVRFCGGFDTLYLCPCSPPLAACASLSHCR